MKNNFVSSKFIFSLLFLSLTMDMKMVMSQSSTIPVNVGVILDMDTWFGKMSLSCISMAVSDFYASHGGYKTRVLLHVRDSMKDEVVAASAALDLIKNVEVQAIIGPTTSMQTEFVIDLGEKAQVPIIAFSATSPSLSSSNSPYFIRACLDDSSQVKAISALIKAFGYREVVPIYVQNEYGEGVIPFLTDALQDINARVPYRSVISPLANDTDIELELYKLMTMQTRVFIVHMLPSLATRVFKKAEEIGMMSEGYVWIVTDAVGNLYNSINSSVITDSMQGVLGVKAYVPKSKALEEFKVRWRRNFQRDNPTTLIEDLNIFGFWAYDAVIALATSIENINTTNFGFINKTNFSNNNLTDLETFGTSLTGFQIQQELSNTLLNGLSGYFHLVNGQLQLSAFELFNVIGDGSKRIGFWTPGNGLSRILNFTETNNSYSTSRNGLGNVFWPGETTVVPKGWVMPTDGKRLKIGVPIKEGFVEFVNVTIDKKTNRASVTGYCIDVFHAVIQAMPYGVPYDFVPFAQPNGSSTGSYDDLTYQVFQQVYDAVVGDLTIVANRSHYVDFALPYTESGVSMIVPMKDQRSKKAFVFLEPWTWKLWVTTFCFFVFIGFVIWVLEHRINEDFRGPPTHQAGMILWFSFSTMVFAHKEKVLNNWARFVVIVWLFVVLILTQSYTASLTSILTVQQLKPSFTDVKELIKSGESVGYQKGSFVFGFLKEMGFAESKLRPYDSTEECDQLFNNGSANGGIAAAFDETPYMRLFLGQYCSKYTMVGPVYKTAGFGFAFPIGSPLVSDVSRSVLEVTEGAIMTGIEQKWFGNQANCAEINTRSSSNSLDLDSFWGLFLIAGVASASAFLINAGTFLYENRHVLIEHDLDKSIWRKMVIIYNNFDQKDMSSHTFRKSETHNMSDMNGCDRLGHGSVDASPNNNVYPQSPSTYSNHTHGSNMFSFGGQGTPDRSPDRHSPHHRVGFIEMTQEGNEHESGNGEDHRQGDGTDDTIARENV